MEIALSLLASMIAGLALQVVRPALNWLIEKGPQSLAVARDGIINTLGWPRIRAILVLAFAFSVSALILWGTGTDLDAASYPPAFASVAGTMAAVLVAIVAPPMTLREARSNNR